MRAREMPRIVALLEKRLSRQKTIQVHQDPNSGKLVRMGRGEKVA